MFISEGILFITLKRRILTALTSSVLFLSIGYINLAWFSSFWDEWGQFSCGEVEHQDEVSF